MLDKNKEEKMRYKNVGNTITEKGEIIPVWECTSCTSRTIDSDSVARSECRTCRKKIEEWHKAEAEMDLI